MEPVLYIMSRCTVIRLILIFSYPLSSLLQNLLKKVDLNDLWLIRCVSFSFSFRRSKPRVGGGTTHPSCFLLL